MKFVPGGAGFFLKLKLLDVGVTMEVDLTLGVLIVAQLYQDMEY